MRRHIDPNWEIAAPDVKAMIDANEAVMLLDVRQPEETEISLIAGSEVCPLPSLHQHVESIRGSAAGRLIVTICHHGHRSVQAAALLREAGIGRVLSLAGGIDAWSVQVDPAIARY